MDNLFKLAGKRLINPVDRLNDMLTSYRLMLYFLVILAGWAILGSFFPKQIPYSWHEILASIVWLLIICWAANKLISRFLNIPANKESDLITALILALIMSPPKYSRDFALLAAAGILAIASKYVITLYKSHVFNPAALGAFVSGELFNHYASWWVGTKFMTPVVVIGGVLVLRKMKRFTLVGLFLATYILYLIYAGNSNGDIHILWQEIISSPVLFFATVMLIEPLTSPSQAGKYIPYGVLVGLLYSVTRLRLSPEEALLIGNVFAYIIAPKRRFEMKFLRRVKEAEGIYSYLFKTPTGFKFTAGQYLEWTLSQNKTDSRGNRRYLTISSAPTEAEVRFTLKYPLRRASAFKQRLANLKPGEVVLASDLSGSFTLPKDQDKKLVFMAGGVGITPFRSMVQSMIDSGQKRDIQLIYTATSDTEFSFKNIFNQAESIGLKTSYITGRLETDNIPALVHDYKVRSFYISGPYSFVQAIETSLLKLGVGPTKITTDFFPGYGS